MLRSGVSGSGSFRALEEAARQAGDVSLQLELQQPRLQARGCDPGARDLRGEARGDERSGLERSLDDYGALAERRDDAIAPGEVLRKRRRAERIFADDQPASRD